LIKANVKYKSPIWHTYVRQIVKTLHSEYVLPPSIKPLNSSPSYIN